MGDFKVLFCWDLCTPQVPMLGIFACILLGLWAVGTNLSKVLSGKMEMETEDESSTEDKEVDRSKTFWCWTFLVVWLFYFVLVFLWSRSRHLDRVKKDSQQTEEKKVKEAEEKRVKEENLELEKKQKEKEKKEKADKVSWQNEVKKNQEDQKKLTEGQQKDINSINVAIGQMKTAQESMRNESNQKNEQIHQNLGELSSAIDVIDSKIGATQTANAKDKFWFEYLINRPFSQKEKSSMRRSSLYSTKSL